MTGNELTVPAEELEVHFDAANFAVAAVGFFEPAVAVVEAGKPAVHFAQPVRLVVASEVIAAAAKL